MCKSGHHYGNAKRLENNYGTKKTSSGVHLVEVGDLLRLDHFHLSMGGYFLLAIVICLAIWFCRIERRQRRRQAFELSRRRYQLRHGSRSIATVANKKPHFQYQYQHPPVNERSDHTRQWACDSSRIYTINETVHDGSESSVASDPWSMEGRLGEDNRVKFEGRLGEDNRVKFDKACDTFSTP